MIYDTFQQRAIDYVNKGYSVIVSAPTGAGKTVIAEYVIKNCLEKNKNVIYTAPIKALSNQKFRDFQEIFPERIGILTGDVTINPQSPVLIMTTEIFRNKLLEESHTLKNYSWVIFDEIHYLDDYERGTVWEESLIFLPHHMKMLALSATIPNIEEFASWIRSIHKSPIKIIKEESRPVPLHFFYHCQGKIFDNIRRIRHFLDKSRYIQIKPNKPVALIKHLFEKNRLPCIYFAFGRRRCEYLANEIKEFDFLDLHEKQKILNLYEELCMRFEILYDKSAQALLPLIKRGIAFHHAGMLPTLKEVIERLFTSRLMKVIFTTETFALGINMPARTVIFDELRKFYGKYHRPIKTRDFYQMAGRAGRRGIDPEGFVYSRINPRSISYSELKNIIYGDPEMVSSRFNASYATILNLYQKHKEKLYNIYPLSFHHFQESKRLRKKAYQLLRAKVNLLKELGYIQEGTLTEKGNFASKIYGYELSLSEFYDKQVFEYLSELELAIIAVALVFEPRKGSCRPKMSRRIQSIQEIANHTINHIHYIEKKFRISPLSKKYYFHLAPCMHAWIHGETFDKILRYTDVDEGEIIRYFRMAIQILREILETPASYELKQKIGQTISKINRDLIDAEKQLRC